MKYKDEISIDLELHGKLNSKAVRYWLGTDELLGNLMPRIKQLLDDIEVLCDKANQYTYLENMGLVNTRLTYDKVVECEQCGDNLDPDKIYECVICSKKLCEHCVDGQDLCNDCSDNEEAEEGDE